ncbi:hypothetical protein [Lysinibacter cavernae]|uniref:Uncharacterized protein n=1 Tax=Lysinibacter cavernae TaxID=1640652 RepID=A0A7X5TU48_9MICO|nr:hypothetical protein [Lysinibacter cavernae]NIH53257.1 hypothetical protein [Lysinibacter cavernae]
MSRLVTGWQFRDGNEIELSDAGRTVLRVRGMIGVVAMLVASGIILSLWAQHEQSEAAREAETARAEFQQQVDDLWGNGGTNVSTKILIDDVLPATGEPNEDTAGSSAVVGYQVVQDSGTSPAYLQRVPGWKQRGSADTALAMNRERDALLSRADLVIGVTTRCDVSGLSVESDPERVIIRIDRVPSELVRQYSNGVGMDAGYCAKSGPFDPIALVPIDLPEPLGNRAVMLPDGSAVAELTADLP